jgi:hypothetical protein
MPLSEGAMADASSVRVCLEESRSSRQAAVSQAWRYGVQELLTQSDEEVELPTYRDGTLAIIVVAAADCRVAKIQAMAAERFSHPLEKWKATC